MKRFIISTVLALVLTCLGKAQAPNVQVAPVVHQIFLSATGVPLASGCVTTSISGTNTPQPTYTDSTALTQNANPIILGADGGADIWMTNTAYRFTVVAYDGIPGNKCAAGVQLYVRDGINPWSVVNASSNFFLAGNTSDPAGTAGEITYRSDIPCMRFFTTFWDCVVRLTDTQTLTNKTLSSPAITGSSTGSGVQGTDSKLLTAGTVSGTGSLLCTDANGGATTSGCGIVAKFDATNQTASVSTTTLYAVPSNGAGTYRLTCFAVISQAATTSSTLPGCNLNYTDQDSGVVIGASITTGSTQNTTGTFTPLILAVTPANGTFEAKASTNITFNFTGYASSGATPMAYAVHVKLEYLGP